MIIAKSNAIWVVSMEQSHCAWNISTSVSLGEPTSLSMTSSLRNSLFTIFVYIAGAIVGPPERLALP